MKTVEIYKHPYMWKVQIKFGTLQEMLDNSPTRIHYGEMALGGSFNKQMDSGNRAALIQIGLEIQPTPERLHKPNAKDITEVKGICMSNWEGTYWYIDAFDEELKNGLYPISADWDGKTYIYDGAFDENHEWKSWYRITDTYRY